MEPAKRTMAGNSASFKENGRSVRPIVARRPRHGRFKENRL
jgi:hypothetical protein